jgi:hypothetical protein
MTTQTTRTFHGMKNVESRDNAGKTKVDNLVSNLQQPQLKAGQNEPKRDHHQISQ